MAQVKLKHHLSAGGGSRGVVLCDGWTDGQLYAWMEIKRLKGIYVEIHALTDECTEIDGWMHGRHEGIRSNLVHGVVLDHAEADRHARRVINVVLPRLVLERVLESLSVHLRHLNDSVLRIHSRSLQDSEDLL